jgi:hypothetical protein
MLWRCPPSIADVSSGAWSYFREKSEVMESEEDKTFMLKLGKSNSEKQVEEGDRYGTIGRTGASSSSSHYHLWTRVSG